jgi:hypothetical protein
MGGAIVAAAFFAETIGLDNDPGWGKGRIAILVIGVFIIACGVFYSLYTEIVLAILRKLRSLGSRNIVSLLKFFQTYGYTLPIIIFVILVYVWFASFGSWTDWQSATNYYANLAMGFRAGKLHLLIEPNSELLSLSNPYDPSTRQGVSFPVDYSLYNGKFYLYWGPIPALILAVISPLFHSRVGDLYLVFSFVCGIFLLQFLLTIKIWDRFFRDLPKWILALSIFVPGLTLPWIFMLINEPNGRIYEAAISGGQFFLLGSFLAAVLAFDRPATSPLLLALTGFLSALAIGTRLIIALPIGFMILMVAYRIWKTSSSTPGNLSMQLIFLGLPLMLGLTGLGWYNWARFGSVTETGLSYQLAAVNMGSHGLFSPIYFIQNLYSYLLQPPYRIPQFPFLYPKEISPVIGLLFIAPFTVFAILPITTSFIKTVQKDPSGSKASGNDFLDWIITSLLGTFSCAFCMMLIFFWIAIRYMADFMPALTLLSVLGFWQGYRLLTQRPSVQRFYSILGIILASTSFGIHILISIAVKQLGRTGM